MLDTFQNYKIPILDWGTDAGSYSNVPVDSQHPLHNDELGDLSGYPIAIKSYYNINDGTNVPYRTNIPGSLNSVFCRKQVAENLLRVNCILKTIGLEVLVWDGYRTIETQQGLWDFFTQHIQSKIDDAGNHEVNLESEIIKYVSDPNAFEKNDSCTWPSHTTGGAVDVGLQDIQQKKMLEMGTHFDDMSEKSHTDYYERLLKEGSIDSRNPYLINRRILYWAMSSCGFINYPLEYWHYDWGNQMYSFHQSLLLGTKPNAAWYGYLELES